MLLQELVDLLSGVSRPVAGLGAVVTVARRMGVQQEDLEIVPEFFQKLFHGLSNEVRTLQ